MIPYLKEHWKKAEKKQKQKWTSEGYAEPVSDYDFGSHEKADSKEKGVKRHKQALLHTQHLNKLVQMERELKDPTSIRYMLKKIEDRISKLEKKK